MWRTTRNPIDPNRWDTYKSDGSDWEDFAFFLVPCSFSLFSWIFLGEYIKEQYQLPQFGAGCRYHWLWVLIWVIFGICTRKYTSYWYAFGIAVVVIPLTIVGIALAYAVATSNY